jgi:hypothetical protein
MRRKKYGIQFFEGVLRMHVDIYIRREAAKSTKKALRMNALTAQ